jgi:nucleotide-binding universal stress UspA family protein
MYERILVPLDGSDVGEAALPYVRELATSPAPNMKVEIILLQVIPTLTHYVASNQLATSIPYTDKEVEQIKDKAKGYLDEVAQRLKSKGVTVKTKVSTGHAAEEIIKAAEETKAGLVAMSTHGRSGISRWVLGSVTDKVLREGKVPILTVSAPGKAKKA